MGAVRQIDEIDHAEHQREAGRDQKQKNAELQSVEDLDKEERACHGTDRVGVPRLREAGRLPSVRCRAAKVADCGAAERYFIAQSLAYESP